MERLIEVGTEMVGPPRSITWEKMVEFERVVWDRGPTAHNSRETANKGGMERAFASGQNVLAFFHELFEREFGDGWIAGGTISVRWTRVVYEGDTITVHARVEAIGAEGARRRARLAIWADNQAGEQTAAGTATALLS